MTLKEATANSLLMFVAATCVVLIVKAISPTPQSSQAGVGGAAVDAPPLATQDGVQVYYIHGSFRCSTCQTIEAYAKEAVESGFPEELRDGRIEWHAINYEDPGNERYAVDYEVVAPTVVLARFEGGRQVEWKGLHEVWELVGDKGAFLNFVQKSLREFMGASQAQVPTPTVPVFSAPIPEAPPSEPPIPDMPIPDMPVPEMAVPEMAVSEPLTEGASVSEPQVPDTARSETALPLSPLRSPAESPQFFLPIPE